MKKSIISSKEEFELIFVNYLIPLLGLNNSNQKYEKHENQNEELVEIKDQKLYFYESKNSNNCFSVTVSKNFPKNNVNMLKMIYSEMLKIRHKNYDNSIKNKYDSLQHLKKNYEYKLQKSLLDWFSGSNVNLLGLIEQLEHWKEKTYEGKKVPFAFLINPQSTQGEFNFMEFLEEEFSATFSDGITSIIELDSKLDFLAFKSITNTEENVSHKLDNTPYRFSQIIETFTKDKMAIFLLINGDIVLVKNCEILLVKREGKWLNFNKEVFKSIIYAELRSNKESFLDLLNEIYLSALDVSFAHSGGIIACVKEEKISSLIDSEKNKSPILDPLDNLLPSNIVKTPKTFNSKEDKKRFLKRNFLLNIINGENFLTIDRKLRSELISMDGATILDFNGNVISVGAIIQNDSGSYGGGRGAAAKKLSKYGFAIKISTDGYIEVYIEERIKYKIK